MDGLGRAKQDARAESTNSRRFRRRREQLRGMAVPAPPCAPRHSDILSIAQERCTQVKPDGTQPSSIMISVGLSRLT